MEQELLLRISKELNEQERALAIKSSLCYKINPAIMLAYFILLAANGIAYFYTFFTNGHPRSLWLSITVVVAIPLMLYLLHKALHSHLYPKAQATCGVTVPEWTPDRFPNMDAVLAEKKRLNRSYNKGVWMPLLPLLLSAPVLVLCYHCAAALSELPPPAGSTLHLVLTGLFYSLYGFLVFLCNSETASPSLSREASNAIRDYTKAQASRADKEQQARKQAHAAAEKERRLNEMVSKALRQDPPDFALLYKAASQGAQDAVAQAGRALVPFIIKNYPQAHELTFADQERRERCKAMANTFEKHAAPRAESGDAEAEFALMAARYYSGHPQCWMDLRDHAIPRIQELLRHDAIATHWGALPTRLLADMERVVEMHIRLSEKPVTTADATPLSNDVHDDLRAIQGGLAEEGLCHPPADLTTDV